jgi:hypothetical protein
MGGVYLLFPICVMKEPHRRKDTFIMLLTGLLVLITLALSSGWLIGGRRNMILRNMGLITLGLSLVLFFTTK